MHEKSPTLEYLHLQKLESKAVAENHRSFFDKPVHRLNELLEEKTDMDMMQEITRITEPVLEKYLKSYTPFQKRSERRARILSALGMVSEADYAGIPLSRIDQYTDTFIQKSGFIVSLTGGIGAVGGIAVGLMELPVLLNKGFETMEEVCEAFGYDAEDYFERLYILMVLLFSLIPDSESRRPVYAKLKLIEGWIRQGDVPLSEKESYYPAPEAAAFCAGHLASAMTVNRIYQAVPLAGALLGASMNFGFVNRLGRNSRSFYKRRFLEKKLGLNP